MNTTIDTAPAPTTAAEARPWRGIFCFGPDPVQDKEGEEQPSWAVYVGDEHADPVAKVYHISNYKRALGLAQVMSQDRNLEFINEAQEA